MSWLRNLLFFALLIILSGIYGQFESTRRGPYSRHQWRQTDCLSITQNYYQKNLSFWEPEIFWLGENSDGKTVSEMPIVYYGIAKIWQITGKKYWIYRGFTLLVVFLGLFYLQKLIYSLTKQRFWSFFVPFFLFTSPALIYYSNNFIMDPIALGLAFIAAYHYVKYRKENKILHLYFACALFLLAGWLKITALLLFFSFGAVVLFEAIKKRNLRPLIPFVLSFAGVIAWYVYSAAYNEKHMSGIFLQGLLPIWELDWTDIQSNFTLLFESLLPEFLPYTGVTLLVLFTALILFRFKRMQSEIKTHFILVSLGIVLYIILFFQVFNVHEYYLLNLLVIVPLIWLLVIHYLSAHRPEILQKKWLKAIAIVGLLFFVYNGAVQTRVKYSSEEKWVTESPLLSEENKNYYSWYHWYYSVSFQSLETIEPYLESIGVGKNAKVLSIPDGSINISLYLMNRKGYTNFWVMKNPENQNLVGIDRLKKCIEWGAEYIVVNENATRNDSTLTSLFKDSIGSYGTVTIYKAPPRSIN